MLVLGFLWTVLGFIPVLPKSAELDPGPPGNISLVRETWVMGTHFRVEVEGKSLAQVKTVTEKVIRAVEAADQLLSTWDSTTEVSQVNRTPPWQPVEISDELASILLETLQWTRRTRGAFDPSIGTLIDAWNAQGGHGSPTPEVLDRAQAAPDSQAFEVRRRAPHFLWTSSRGRLDTGAFGKGAALRWAAAILESEGVERALLDLGGQLYALGDSHDPWFIGVAHPKDRLAPVTDLQVHGVSVATSGISDRDKDVAGMYRSHILDPRSGQPVPPWGSVTVVAEDPLTADILATALYVMGPETGLAWVRLFPDVGALFLEACGNETHASWNQAMEPWFPTSPKDREGEATTPCRQQSNRPTNRQNSNDQTHP